MLEDELKVQAPASEEDKDYFAAAILMEFSSKLSPTTYGSAHHFIAALSVRITD